MKKILFFIFLLALLLRLFKLEEFPVGFHADEVRVAWNSLSILKTTKDDRGATLPMYYNTFGDYRPTGIFYTTIPFIQILGNTELAVRLPSALFGALTIIPLFLFVRQLTKNKSIALTSAALLTISPWHIEVSRATSEVVISTFFSLAALYCFLLVIKTESKKYAIYTLLLTLVSYFFYHSIRILAPMFFITTGLYFWKDINQKTKRIVIAVCVAVSLLTFAFSFSSQARQRLSQVSIFTDPDVIFEYQSLKPNRRLNIETLFHSKLLISFKRFVTEYGTYFSPDFLIGEKARPYRYTTPGAGLLSMAELILLTIGIVNIIRKKYSALPLLLFLIAPIPAALTTEDVPNLHRAFLMVPFLITMEAIAFSSLTKKFNLFILLLLIISTIFFIHQYLTHSKIHMPFLSKFTIDNPSYRNIGAKELAIKLENIKDNYEKIVVTNHPDDVYSWYAFFTDKNPIEFNKYAIQRSNGPWLYENILFTWSKCPSDTYFNELKEEKILVIDSSECPYQAKIKDGTPIKVIDKIVRSDNSEVYILLERSDN